MRASNCCFSQFVAHSISFRLAGWLQAIQFSFYSFQSPLSPCCSLGQCRQRRRKIQFGFDFRSTAGSDSSRNPPCSAKAERSSSRLYRSWRGTWLGNFVDILYLLLSRKSLAVHSHTCAPLDYPLWRNLEASLSFFVWFALWFWHRLLPCCPRTLCAMGLCPRINSKLLDRRHWCEIWTHRFVILDSKSALLYLSLYFGKMPSLGESSKHSCTFWNIDQEGHACESQELKIVSRPVS